jgi:hypothetical protein
MCHQHTKELNRAFLAHSLSRRGKKVMLGMKNLKKYFLKSRTNLVRLALF